MTWNYRGRGEEVADGIGGTCKRTADRIIAQGNDIATSEQLLKVLGKIVLEYNS